MTIIDITYTTNIGERHGRRRMYDNHADKVWWDPEEPVVPEGHFDGPPNLPLGPVEPLPEASVEQPSADPAPPEPTKSVAKRVKAQAKRLIHG